ncbi:hypothetical protein CA13_11350 [Planctomycetes bacterium CA13]|uniref:Uncharacterized protein n=1 Tax=Novipirellula herctigrandis TaxID=2527986 RepID=A0A5C5YXD8_9BACT|nr:hypothetical protein CA13_11350 [Planctomycetes bacterium CA13]
MVPFRREMTLKSPIGGIARINANDPKLFLSPLLQMVDVSRLAAWITEAGKLISHCQVARLLRLRFIAWFAVVIGVIHDPCEPVGCKKRHNIQHEVRNESKHQGCFRKSNTIKKQE